MFRYHVVGCRQLGSQELLDQGYATALSGHTLRFSEKEVSSHTVVPTGCRVLLQGYIQPGDSVPVPWLHSFNNTQPGSEVRGRGV